MVVVDTWPSADDSEVGECEDWSNLMIRSLAWREMKQMVMRTFVRSTVMRKTRIVA